ncbi:DR2241 family protein [Halospeciosus flavus]|uniref:DR2241 family protein n=1 Tax=Halospeciosus flavus TaxID=3032283 RepID=A0ABD5Z2H0_9EURY|nr:DR2241 family protein [Halospeciosus flavus]
MSQAIAALLQRATDGIDFDGLEVESTAYGYRFETPERSERGLGTDELQDVAAEDPYVRNWYYWETAVGGHGTHRRAFLRWVEHADEQPVDERLAALTGAGLTRSWGELELTARVEDGTHTYEVRHEDDADVPLDALDTYDDPLDARHLVEEDEKGRYRPLKTAPTLQTGWAFSDLDGDALVETVDFVYPATVANWHREREDELDVEHWVETADRQTGIFDVVDELPREALEWAAEACCADSQCLKRREWDYSEDDELDVPRGDGEFPCREPCSLFVTAARKFTTLEREESREYTFELTPSEKEQLEAILDTVADGATDEIREADLDEGANRYRARYLRAKRMDGDDLSGTATDADE